MSESKKMLPPPTQRELFHPMWIYRWSLDCVMSWLGTRPMRALKLGLPFLALVAVTAMLPSLANTDQTVRYERALKAAEESGDTEAALIAINRLMRHSPSTETYRFRLAEHHLATGDHTAAFRLLDGLAPVSKDVSGYAAAHRKLVMLSLDEESEIKIRPDRQLFHLRRMWEQNKDEARVNQLLVKVYLERNLPELAEQHLARIAESSVVQMLRFAELESRLGKPDNALKAAKLAEEMAAKDLAANPESQAARLMWAKTLLLQGRTVEAENRLRVLAESAPGKSEVALIEFYTTVASRRIKQSRLLRQEAAEIVSRALKLNPTAIKPASLFSNLVANGATVPVDLREQLRDAWSQHCRENKGDGTTLLVGARILKACGKLTEALDVMEASAAASPALTEDYAQMLLDADQPEKAKQVLETLRQTMTNDGTEATVLRLARVNRMLGNNANAIQLVQEIAEPSPALRRELMRAIMADAESTASTAAKELQRLEAALEVYPQDARLLSRVAALGQQDSNARKQARRLLLAKVTDGSLPADRVFVALGTAASIAKNYQLATKDLREAVRLTTDAGRTADPVTRNNLAIALLRSPMPAPEEALREVDAALKQLPGQIDLVITRGEALVAAEDWSAAVATLTPTLRFRIGDKLVHRLLSQAYSGLGNSELAEQHAEHTTGMDGE